MLIAYDQNTYIHIYRKGGREGGGGRKGGREGVKEGGKEERWREGGQREKDST